ncbi:hypothetical protein O3M35_001057 [Rhynocoris fuscipes]|uniref:Uncharacterized protein n=1 Tax=Rhynocoris fuscipes TaxID=488301 RepID=A0AAW1DTS9_9HEMI
MHKTTIIVLIAVCMMETLTSAQPDDKQGGVSIDVNEERGQGTRVEARGRQEIWRSDDDRARAEVYGHWDRTYGGSNDGQRSYGYGGRFEYNWGK